MGPETSPESRHHHENEKGFQKNFHKDIRALVDVIEEFGNPFEEEGKELSVLDTKVVADEGVSRMQNIEELGRKQCDAFIPERKKPLDDPITRNTLSFFETPIKKKTSKAHQQLLSMKNDCFPDCSSPARQEMETLMNFFNIKTKRAPHPSPPT